ncbi:MAG: small conductance mechanosensitive channel [Kiritimatiellia bacterium]|jgi:small conductance mechanosensitive channel
MFSLKHAGCIICLLVGAAHLAAANDVAATHQRLEHIEKLIRIESELQVWERDGLNNRIDQLGIALISEVNEIATDQLADKNLAPEVREEIFALLDAVAELALVREKRLDRRAAEEHERYEKFAESAQADIARAFQEDLLQLREQFLSGFVSLLEVRRAAGHPAEESAAQIRDRVLLLRERLTGQIRLDAMSLAELRRRLKDKPLDERLENASALVQAKQSTSLDALEGLLGIADRLGLETAEQRSLLIRERRQVGTDILDRDVFRSLWEENVRALNQQLVRRGPDWFLRLLLLATIVIIAWVLSRLVRYPIRALVRRRRPPSNTLLGEVAISLSSALVLLTGLVCALAFVGVSLGPILAGLGVLGLVVGLAIQDSLGNLAAGTMILLYRPYDVDDHIRVNGVDGLVKRMNLLATSITTFDNQSVVVPNGRIWGDTIINYTAHRVRRVDVKVTFSYHEDPDRVQSVLLDVLEKHEDVLDNPAPVVHVAGFEDSAMAMMVKPWVRTENYWSVYWDLNRVIKKRFDAEGIEIPFPQRVVTLAARTQEAEPPSD